ncbi:helix-turn-helix domain-containing protein [Pedobacter nanyangensis]|uniref:helix-turn-helix domain-containing protein n=1 Tax=Pedobacter nanyangensis TaxID=1562389 RepID=UPI000DE23E4C|nr:helix-turn-helix domain-containing protein [Pedobacter nanyangensis]
MKNPLENRPRLYREQLLTVEDMEQFKFELLEAMKKLLKSNGTPPPKKWLKTDEVRKILGISAGKLLNLRINGTLPYTKIGGVIYYDQDDIQQMFSSRKFQHP